MHGDSTLGPNPSGLCMCGCGQTTTIASKTDTRHGVVGGQPRKFIHGHTRTGTKSTAAHRAKIVAALTGRKVSPETRAKLGAVPKPKADQSPLWKGGRYRSGGNVLVYVGQAHPMASASGYVLEHRLVAATALGRFLESDEHVHHVDLDHQNNDVTNLVVVSPGQHQRIHWLIRRGSDPVAAVAEVTG